nr:hypothetical protein [Acidicapsa acidisoli]
MPLLSVIVIEGGIDKSAFIDPSGFAVKVRSPNTWEAVAKSPSALM